MTHFARSKTLVAYARRSCPAIDVGWLEAAAESLLDAADHADACERAAQAAAAPDWHELNRRARMAAAAKRLDAARRRVDALSDTLRRQVDDWRAGETIYDPTSTAVGQRR